jgi:1-acyl-sn-glycerol-3-phosphate acyltransferase
MATQSHLLSVSPQDIPGLLVQPQALDTPWHWRLMRFLSALAIRLFGWYFPMRVMGTENIPRRGPLLVIINHLSVMDIPTLGALLIRAGWHPGVTMFTIAKQEVFQRKIVGWLAPRLGMFPVVRNQVDLSAMRTMLSILKRGYLLGIAPEGTRSPTGHLQLFQPSVAKLAIQKRVPILPVGLVGVEQVMPIGSRLPRRVPIQVIVGAPFELSEYYDKALTAEDLERAAWDMRAHVAELLPEWMGELPPEDVQARFGSVLSRTQPVAP